MPKKTTLVWPISTEVATAVVETHKNGSSETVLYMSLHNIENWHNGEQYKLFYENAELLFGAHEVRALYAIDVNVLDKLLGLVNSYSEPHNEYLVENAQYECDKTETYRRVVVSFTETDTLLVIQ